MTRAPTPLRRPRTILGAAGALAIAAASTALGDSLPYQGVVDLRAAGSDFVVIHHHDWSNPPAGSPWTTGTMPRDLFRHPEPGFVAWYSRDGRVLLRTLPSPPLTWLGVSPDSRYVIGLSDIKLRNPIQLVVYDRYGALLLERHIDPEVACLTPGRYRELLRAFPGQLESLRERVWTDRGVVYVDFLFMGAPTLLGQPLWNALYRNVCASPLSANFHGSVTNAIWWFDRQNPAPEVIEAEGKPIVLRLRDPKGRPFDVPFKLERPTP